MLWPLPKLWDRETPAHRLKSMFLVTTGHSGASAIAPLLVDVLGPRGVSTAYFANETGHLMPGMPDNPPAPYFHWTHHTWEALQPILTRDPASIVFLHRDLRDVACSMIGLEIDHFIKQHRAIGPDEERSETLARLEKRLRSDLFQRIVADTVDWWHVTRREPIKVITFDQVKADTVGVALDLLDWYGLNLTRALRSDVQRLYETKHSFEAVLGRPRGSDGMMRRDAAGFMVRKGASGEWRTKFDDRLKALFDREYGAAIKLLGYPPTL